MNNATISELEKMTSEGLITIAFDSERYVRMACALSLSYKRYNPSKPIAVVPDEKYSKVLEQFFNVVIPRDLAYGRGVVQKLHVDLYSPFEKTLFVDSDCLFYKNPELVWRTYAHGPFCVRGWRYLTGQSEYEKDAPYAILQCPR
jgi:hypothetical protein